MKRYSFLELGQRMPTTLPSAFVLARILSTISSVPLVDYASFHLIIVMNTDPKIIGGILIEFLVTSLIYDDGATFSAVKRETIEAF